MQNFLHMNLSHLSYTTQLSIRPAKTSITVPVVEPLRFKIYLQQRNCSQPSSSLLLIPKYYERQLIANMHVAILIH